MKLVFFDETKNDPDYPYYHLGGICIDESALVKVEAAVQAIALDAFGSAALSSETEFHASAIYHRNDNFKGWLDFDARVAILGRLVDILSFECVQLIDIQINCGLLSGAHSPEDLAFMFLCERANALVQAQKSIGMLIGDRESDRHAARFATSLSTYRASGTEFAFGTQIKNLVDSVHFTHSHLSRFLQLADVYAWILQFTNRNIGSKNVRHQAFFKMLQRVEVNLSPKKYKEWPKVASAASC